MKNQIQIEGDWLISANGRSALEDRINSPESTNLEMMVAEKGEEAVKIPKSWSSNNLQPRYASISQDSWDIGHEDWEERRKSKVQTTFIETSNGQSIAVLAIKGTILYDCSVYQEYWYGVCSMKRIARQLDELRNNNNVLGVVLCVDSPGGAVSGTSLALKHLKLLREKKPVWSVVEMATSGAQLLVAETERIICMTEAVTLGSLGVFTQLQDRSGFEEQIGIKTVYVTATRSVRKLDYRGDQPMSEDAEAAITHRMNQILDWMITVMREGRGISEDSEAFNADMYRADIAIQLGLADEIAEGDAVEAAINGLLVGLRSYIPPSRRIDTVEATNNANTKLLNNNTMSKENLTFANLPAAAEGQSGEIIAFTNTLAARESHEMQETGDYVLVPKSYMTQLDETFANSDVEASAKLKEQLNTVLDKDEKILGAHIQLKKDLATAKTSNDEAQATITQQNDRIQVLEGIITTKIGKDALKGGGGSGSGNEDGSLTGDNTDNAQGGTPEGITGGIESRIAAMQAKMKTAGIE